MFHFTRSLFLLSALSALCFLSLCSLCFLSLLSDPGAGTPERVGVVDVDGVVWFLRPAGRGRVRLRRVGQWLLLALREWEK